MSAAPSVETLGYDQSCLRHEDGCFGRALSKDGRQCVMKPYGFSPVGTTERSPAVHCWAPKPPFCNRRVAGVNEFVTMRRRFGACIIDARWHAAKAFRHLSSMFAGAKSCIIMHENASLGCGSHSLRGNPENHASLASDSHCLREMPCILEGRIGGARRKCRDDNDLRSIVICGIYNCV